MTGYMQLDRALAVAAERQQRADSYRLSHRPRVPRAPREARPESERRMYRLIHGFSHTLSRG
jgi:hypothetical protein